MTMHARDKDAFSHVYYGQIEEQATRVDAIVGTLMQWQDVSGETPTVTRSIVFADPIEVLSSEMMDFYGVTAIMSMEGIVRPVSMDGDGGFPRYIQLTGENGIEFEVLESGEEYEYEEVPYSSEMPVTGYLPGIIQDELNPITNPMGMARSYISEFRSNTPDIGHDFDMLARKDQNTISPDEGLIIPPIESGQEEPDYDDDYRFFALRGPLLIQSWGYDIYGNPVPNEVDDPEKIRISGVFETEGLTDKFMDYHLRKSESWPVAPLDLALDRDRGVWSINAANGLGKMMMVGRVVSPITMTGEYADLLLEFPGTGDIVSEGFSGNALRIRNETRKPWFYGTRCIIAKTGVTEDDIDVISTATDFHIFDVRALEDIPYGESGEVQIYKPLYGDDLKYQNQQGEDFVVYAHNVWSSGDIGSGDEIKIYPDGNKWNILKPGTASLEQQLCRVVPLEPMCRNWATLCLVVRDGEYAEDAEGNYIPRWVAYDWLGFDQIAKWSEITAGLFPDESGLLGFIEDEEGNPQQPWRVLDASCNGATAHPLSIGIPPFIDSSHYIVPIPGLPYNDSCFAEGSGEALSGEPGPIVWAYDLELTGAWDA